MHPAGAVGSLFGVLVVMCVIEVEALSVRYGLALALESVSLSVGKGEMVALIGPNGAGKTTLLNTLSGTLQKSGGRFSIRGCLAHVPEGRQLFSDLTVDDNLRLGAYRLRDRDTSWIYGLLPELERVRKQAAGTLSGGQQQMVALGRGLMSRPDVLAIDEMSLGLAPKVVKEVSRVITRLNAEQELGVLLVEQNAQLAFSLCSRAYVLEAGSIVASGSTADLGQDPAVKRAYLGSPIEATS